MGGRREGVKVGGGGRVADIWGRKGMEWEKPKVTTV